MWDTIEGVMPSGEITASPNYKIAEPTRENVKSRMKKWNL